MTERRLPPSPISMAEVWREDGGGEELQTLESLLEASRTPHGLSLLSAAETLTATLRRLRLPPENFLLLPRLRLLRNLCAGEINYQNTFIASGGAVEIASIVLGPRAEPEVLRAGLQILGNVALAGEDHRAAVWARFFPAGFLYLARVREPGVCDPLCMVLDTCCSSEGGHSRIVELAGVEEGLTILLEIVDTASTVGYHEEWLEWLLCKACIEQPYLSLLFAKLGSSTSSDCSSSHECRSTRFTKAQAFLLCILSKCLSERPQDVTVLNNFALGVMNIMKEATAAVDFSLRGNSPLPTCSSSINVLGYSLTILRDVCAWEDPSDLEAPIDSLLPTGLVQFLLDLLRELELPSVIRKSVSRAEGRAGDPMKVCPYHGFRRDVVSVISNCVHRRKEVQDEIREKGGIFVLLQQCVLDEENPFLREWGLLAVRNLLEGNAENQQEVAALELQGSVNTDEITGLGLRVEIDTERRHAKLVNV